MWFNSFRNFLHFPYFITDHEVEFEYVFGIDSDKNFGKFLQTQVGKYLLFYVIKIN